MMNLYGLNHNRAISWAEQMCILFFFFFVHSEWLKMGFSFLDYIFSFQPNILNLEVQTKFLLLL